VVGIDDIAMAAMSRPALTTVRLPKQRSGELAVELLLTMLDQPDADPPSGGRRQLPGELIVRDSTGVAAGS
jgi:LacI family transcriptional regulator/LacI family repressor for deo operon, udp, cdd, tsx, nupC, and nupG